MDRPKVTVAVPVHNCERFIDDALRSIEAQDTRCRVIVVDDGSIDSTSETLERWKGRVEILRQDRKGPAASRNRALAMADTPYVAFLDADDLWPSGKLSAQLSALESMPQIDIVSGLTGWFEGDPARAQVRPHLTLTLGSSVFRRSALEKLRGFDESIVGDCEDVDLFLRAREAGLRIHVLDRVTSLYRRRAGSMTFGQAPARGNLLASLKRSLDRRRVDGRALSPLSGLGTRVSVIVPVFDGEAYVAEAIESVLGQSRPALEILVVDDGSRDGTPAVLERYRRRIRSLRLDRRSGPSAARNAGIREARGDALCFLDADDLLPPDSLAIGCAALEEDTRPHAVLGLTEYRKMSGERLGETRFYNLGSAIFRRSVFGIVGFFDEERRACEDIDMFLRIREARLAIRAVDRPLLVRRKRPGSMSYGVPVEESGFLMEIKRSMDRRRAGDRAQELPGLMLGDG